EAVPDSNGFWSSVRDLGGADFGTTVDYAGVDVYVDVFGPRVELDKVPGAVRWVLQTYREKTLAMVGIPAGTPIRICENGWPTGPDRPESLQAQVLEATLRTVHGLRAELNVTHWELFTLRDADSSKDEMFHRFGVLRDDYSPKPAFGVLRDLIAELRRGLQDRVGTEFHDGAGGFGDAAGQRRVDRERVGELIHRQVLLDRERDRQDQLTGPRGDHHAAEHQAGAGAGEDLDEAVAKPAHLGARVGGQRLLHHAGGNLAAVHRRLPHADRPGLPVREDRPRHTAEPNS